MQLALSIQKRLGEILKALITGINGFTGRYLAAELRLAGYEVFGLAQFQAAQIPGVEAVYVSDLCDPILLPQVFEKVLPDVVVHLAGISFVGHGNVESIYRTNLIGSRNLLEVLSHASKPLRAVLLASSANVYGNATGGVLDEGTPPAPANDYAVSKLAMEYMARLFMDRLPIIIARPFNYTGVGQSLEFLLPKIVDHFRRLSPVLELGNLDVIRDFSDVRSVARNYRMLLESKQTGQVINVCAGRGYSLQEVLQTMRRIAGYSPEIRVNPAFVRVNEVHRLIGSRAKLDAVIGLQPEIPLKETLQWMYDDAAIPGGAT